VCLWGWVGVGGAKDGPARLRGDLRVEVVVHEPGERQQHQQRLEVYLRGSVAARRAVNFSPLGRSVSLGSHPCNESSKGPVKAAHDMGARGLHLRPSIASFVQMRKRMAAGPGWLPVGQRRRRWPWWRCGGPRRRVARCAARGLRGR
jgi:hypothetical protein